MWRLTNKVERQCKAARDALERSTGGAQDANAPMLGTVLAGVPANVRHHVASCRECGIFAEELVEVREMLQQRLDGPQPGPFFLTRVMASIAEREVELEKRSQIWAAVPRLASRLTVLAALTLLVAGSWLYQPPGHKTSTAAVNAEQSSEGLAEGSTVPIQDDFLLNTAE